MSFKLNVLLIFGLLHIALGQPVETTMKLKWGILSAGRISSDFIKSMKNFNLSEHEIVAIASRNQTRADQYGKKFNISRVYYNYMDLAKDPEVNVVYVATINPYHFAAVKMLLEHKKHVLCEKPLTMNPEDSKELFELAKTNNVFLMEALWSKFLPSYNKTMEMIRQGEIGDLEMIQANFVLSMGDVERLRDVKYGGGITMDIGVYTLNAMLMPMNYVRPLEIKVVGRKNRVNGPDRTVAIALRFPNDVIGSIMMSSHASSNAYQAVNHILYVGTKGYIKLPSPIHASTEIEVNGRKINMDYRDKQRDYNYSHSSGLRFQAEEVRQRLMKGELSSMIMTPEHTMIMSEIQNEIIHQMGIQYPATDKTYEFKQIV